MSDDKIVGTIFAGCKIIAKIGQGGMGSVYKAEHLAMGKIVCVKILSKELSFDQRNIEFFMREARSASKLDHPNIVHVYSFGEEKGLYFIVMSYVDGKTLEDILKENKRMSIPQASEYIMGILEGLAHAHSKNIVHRDIKPSNILVTKEGLPRIADFGLARSVNEEKQLTMAGEMVGTAYFMSPEQGLGEKVDTRADLYATGATFFYLITGKYPYEGKTSIEVISKHINDPLPNLYQIMPEIPLWTAKVIEKLMKKNPDDRYQTAKEVLDEMKKYRDNGWQDIISENENEKTYDLEELKKISVRSEPEFEKDKRWQYEDFPSEKEKSEQKLKKDEEPPQIFDPQKPKFQLTAVHKITRFIYHMGLMFFASTFSMWGGAFISENFSYSGNFVSSIFSATMKNPIGPLAGLLLAIFFAFMASRTKPFKTTPGHFLISCLLCLSLFAGSAALPYPQEHDVFSRLFIDFYFAFAAGLKTPNLWLISLAALIFHIKTRQFKAFSIRIAASIFLVIGTILFLGFSQWACDSADNLPVMEKKLFYWASGLSAAAVILTAARKSIFIFGPSLFYLSALFLFFVHNLQGLTERFYTEISRIESQRYAREMEIYNLRSSISQYEETGEYDTEGRPVLKPKPREQMNPPSKRSDYEIRKEASSKAMQAVLKRLKKQALQTGALLFSGFLLFIYLNALYWEETDFYEKNYLQI